MALHEDDAVAAAVAGPELTTVSAMSRAVKRYRIEVIGVGTAEIATGLS